MNFQTRRQKKLSFGILKKWLHTKGNKVNVKYRNHKLTQLYNLRNPSYTYYIYSLQGSLGNDKLTDYFKKVNIVLFIFTALGLLVGLPSSGPLFESHFSLLTSASFHSGQMGTLYFPTPPRLSEEVAARDAALKLWHTSFVLCEFLTTQLTSSTIYYINPTSSLLPSDSERNTVNTKVHLFLSGLMVANAKANHVSPFITLNSLRLPVG